MKNASAVTSSRPENTTRPIVVDTRNNPLWNALVHARDSDVFHAPAWHQVLYDTYGFETQGYVLTDAAGAPRAGTTWVRIEDARGERLTGMPFSDYCDPLVDDAADWGRLDPDMAADVPARIRCLRDEIARNDPRWRETARARWHGIDLTASAEATWERIEPAARRAVRKAERAGISVRASTTETDVRTFFEMHLAVRKRKYRLLAQPYRFFDAIRRWFMTPGNGVVLLAEIDGAAIGGVLLLCWRDRLYYKFNASHAEELSVRPNDLLMWTAIRYGQERGLRELDLGLSDWDQEGLVRYKRKYATREGVISFHQRDHSSAVGTGAAAASTGSLLRTMTELLTDPTVPDAVTERAGDALYHLFA